MCMKTSMEERIKRVLFGLGLVGGGFFVFIMPFNLAAYLVGLILIGFGIDPRGTEYHVEHNTKHAPATKKSGRKKSRR